MIGENARAALSEEIEFLKALEGAAAAFIGTSKDVPGFSAAGKERWQS
jgi:hypothetical protein